MTRPLSMSVNLSCRQFSQPDLVYQVERLLLETGLDSRCLKMEITESAIMEQVESASSALTKLKALGVKLAMDDFGKGYSSLSYLHQFPFDTLKIDRSFIAGSGPTARTRRSCEPSSLWPTSWASTWSPKAWRRPARLLQLRDLGCQFGQGYFFSRPLTAGAATAILAAPPNWREWSNFEAPELAGAAAGMHS